MLESLVVKKKKNKYKIKRKIQQLHELGGGEKGGGGNKDRRGETEDKT